jgi:hypothetical protein
MKANKTTNGFLLKTDVSEYWAMYYHVYLFFKSGGTLDKAIKKYKRMDVVKYFHQFNKMNPVGM